VRVIRISLKEQKFAGWEGRFTPARVDNTQAQIGRSESAGVNRPSQPANFRMLIVSGRDLNFSSGSVAGRQAMRISGRTDSPFS
jgi:hypothetical protein